MRLSVRQVPAKMCYFVKLAVAGDEFARNKLQNGLNGEINTRVVGLLLRFPPVLQFYYFLPLIDSACVMHMNFGITIGKFIFMIIKCQLGTVTPPALPNHFTRMLIPDTDLMNNSAPAVRHNSTMVCKM